MHGSTGQYLPLGALSREHRRRRTLLVGIAGLILLTFTPVLGHHAFGIASAPLVGVDHLGQVCLIALHELLAPVHSGFHLLLAGGVAYAAWDRVRAWRRVRRVLGPVDVLAPTPGDAFWDAATAAGLDPSRVRVVEGLPNPAFTVGWWRPTVYVALALAERLTPDELTAVLAHEGAHVARRDPLRLSVLRFLAHALFWIPALRRLADDVADEAEIVADDVAVRGQPLVLASALVTLAGWAGGRGTEGNALLPNDVAVGFLRFDLLDRRVRRLAGEDTVPRSHLTRRSLVGATLALGLVWASGLVLVHPLPAETLHAHRHCLHPRDWATSHLFCRHGAAAHYATAAMNAVHCPHAGH